jgi:Raf kinase inhibitor-like YbhB/YbcL family protein
VKKLLVLLVSSLALAQGNFHLEVPAFTAHTPLRSVCDGRNSSPAFAFSGLPAGTRSLALVLWDPGYRGGLIARWVVYDIPPTAKFPAGLPREALLGNGAKQGHNGLGRLGYDAPCQPGQYQIDLYALDVPSLGLPPGAGLHRVKAAIQKHRFAEAILKVSLER